MAILQVRDLRVRKELDYIQLVETVKRCEIRAFCRPKYQNFAQMRSNKASMAALHCTYKWPYGHGP
jgi:hypothetical protein